MQMKETDLAAHLPVCIHLCESRTTERSARSQAAKEYRRIKVEQGDAEKKKEEGTNLRSVRAGRADGPGQRSSGPSMPFPTFQT